MDDEPAQRFILRRIFERAGHEVADAGDGATAVAGKNLVDQAAARAAIAEVTATD